jgi:hypothetical protein
LENDVINIDNNNKNTLIAKEIDYFLNLNSNDKNDTKMIKEAIKN